MNDPLPPQLDLAHCTAIKGTTMKNTLLALLGFILLSTPLAATAQQSGDFYYESDGSEITITGYTGGGGDVTIPRNLYDDATGTMRPVVTGVDE